MFEEIFDYAWIGKRGGVSDTRDVVFGDLSQYSPHYFSGTRFWQAWSKLDHIWCGDGTYFLAHMLYKGVAEIRTWI